jgi:hypothetical protein
VPCAIANAQLGKWLAPPGKWYPDVKRKKAVKSILINANFPAVTCVEREGRRNAAGVAASEVICI